MEEYRGWLRGEEEEEVKVVWPNLAREKEEDSQRPTTRSVSLHLFPSVLEQNCDTNTTHLAAN